MGLRLTGEQSEAGGDCHTTATNSLTVTSPYHENNVSRCVHTTLPRNGQLPCGKRYVPFLTFAS